MTDWSGALARAFQRHLATNTGGAPTDCSCGSLPRRAAHSRGTTGTTSTEAVVPMVVPEKTAEFLGFAPGGTTGTTGTAQIGAHLQSAEHFADFEERAAIVEDGAGVPREWAEGFARLDLTARRLDPTGARARRLLDDAGRFLDQWGNEAARIGWSAIDVFGVPADDETLDLEVPRGLVPLIRGGTVEAISHDRATIRMPDGGMVVYLRRPPVGRSSNWERV